MDAGVGQAREISARGSAVAGSAGGLPMGVLLAVGLGVLALVVIVVLVVRNQGRGAGQGTRTCDRGRRDHHLPRTQGYAPGLPRASARTGPRRTASRRAAGRPGGGKHATPERLRPDDDAPAPQQPRPDQDGARLCRGRAPSPATNTHAHIGEVTTLAPHGAVFEPAAWAGRAAAAGPHSPGHGRTPLTRDESDLLADFFEGDFFMTDFVAVVFAVLFFAAVFFTGPLRARGPASSTPSDAGPP